MLSIHMHDDGRVRMVQQDSGQPQKVKYVALQDVITAFRDQALASPLLPPGTVQYWRGYQYETIAVYTPAHTRTMSLCNKNYENMPVPATLFVFQFYKNDDGFTLSDSGVFALDGDFQGETTKLYHFPYGNVFDDHKICWGEVENHLKSVVQAGSLVDLFLGSDYNYDLDGRFQWSEGEDLSDDDEGYLAGFWKKMQGQDKFPKEHLIDTGTYKDLTDILYFIRN